MSNVKFVVNLSRFNNSQIFTANNGKEYIAIPIEDNSFRKRTRNNGEQACYATINLELRDSDIVWATLDDKDIGMIKMDKRYEIIDRPIIQELIKEFGCTIE